MRSGVWWSAAALTLLFVVASALRNPQVDGTSRISRRLVASDSSNVSSTGKTEETQPTFRPRSSRRREESTTARKEETSRDVARTRSRNRPSQKDVTPSINDQLQSQTPRNERFDSRRTSSRSRSRPVEKEENIGTSTTRDNIIRSRTRSNTRRAPIPLPSTPIPLEVSTSITEDKPESETINTNFEDIAKTLPKEDNTINQFKRRSSTSRSIVETTTLKRNRGRGNRANSRTLDLEVSGTTNTLSALLGKEQTTVRSGDIRDSRKLRYRTRPSETDTNLTGEGLTKLNEVIGSSQNKETSNIQSDALPAPSVSVDNVAQQNTEKNPIKTTKVIRRPLARGKVNFRPAVALPKTKVSEEISEDDNYPASFKALIQAKNATQTSSTPSESLSVRASQKVFNTYPQSSQSIHTDQEIDKQSLLRSKLNMEDDSEKTTHLPENLIETSISDAPKTRSVEYRPRGTYIPRNRKANSSTSSTTSPSSNITEKHYKFSRKFSKSTTTTTPKSDNSLKNKRAEISNSIKKPLPRSSYLSRKTLNVSVQTPTPVQNDKNDNTSTLTTKSRGILPRTAYYSRLRNKVNKTESITSADVPKVDSLAITTAEKKAENTAEMPVILTMLNGASKQIKSEDNNEEKGKNIFVIDVTSTESIETSNDNEVIDKVEETDNKSFVNIISTTQKYHSHYNDKSTALPEPRVKASTGAAPPIRNLLTRKYGRKFSNRKDSEDILVSSTPKIREKGLRKYSDTFSKTTEPSTNVITLESEKPKNRFSSKYRASYLDKPFYKPTVPTVTPSTAWLKFFVTDQQLTKSVEEPKWFEGEDSYDVTTQQMSRQNITIPTITHESSIELVEGEEIQLGPDMNAISFTQSGGTLSSADLRLSESLAKPLQVMNVEASHHSPSVTVSIFDALAEILTSTPRPRISTTTEVMQTQNTNSGVKQTLNGVSNNINVNSVSGLTSQDTLSTISIKSNTKSVQITDTITPNVFNSMSVGDNVTPSLKNEEVKTTFVNTPLPTSTLLPTTPTTPLSARRPFAIKVLYSDTESSTDKITTAFVPPATRPSTDSPPTVYNSVSDLLLSNNQLLSSELTSMLSNNIKSIIKNMDEDSKSRISVDMEKILKSLIPRALDKLSTDVSNADSVPNTTPYSLEDINDTANIDINNQLATKNFLQNRANLSPNNVNIVKSNSDEGIVTKESSLNAQAVNSLNLISVRSMSDNQTPAAEIMLVTESSTQEPMSLTVNKISNTVATAALSRSDIDFANMPILLNNDQSGVVTTTSIVDNLSVTTNKPAPVPFFTNFQLEDFSSNDDQNSNLPQLMTPSTNQVDNGDDIQDPSQLSPLQLWILSKKAKVLKMIEDLIRQHNTEIATGPITDKINEPNVQFSSRLTEIMSAMNFTTESSDMSTTEPIVATTTSFPFPSSELSVTSPNLFDRIATEISQTTTFTAGIIESTTLPLDIAFSTAPTDIGNLPLQTTSEKAEAFPSTTPMATTESTTNRDLFRSQGIADTTAINKDEDQASTPTNTEMAQLATSENIETTTISIDTDSTTVTTDSAFETTTQAGIDTTTITLINETKSNEVITVNSRLNVATPATVPKKDYVIFGILPNNTVVRKDPNDNVLESLTEASPYIIYGVLPNNTVIRKFPNGTRVPRIMQKIDVLPISPWSLRNPYSPIHNIPAIVRPRSNPIRVSTNTVTSTDTTNNGTENQLTTDIVNNLQTMISSSALNIKDSSSLGITTATNRAPAEKSTASHVLSLRTTTMLPSVDEILLNSISSATKEEMVISSMSSSTREPRILTLDIDPETKQIRTERPTDGNGNTVFKFIPIDEVTVTSQESNVLKLASTKMPKSNTMNDAQTTITESNTQTVTESNTQTPQIQTRIENFYDTTSTTQINAATPFELTTEGFTTQPSLPMLMNELVTTTESVTLTTEPTSQSTTLSANTPALTTTQVPTTTIPTTTTFARTATPFVTTTIPATTTTVATTTSTVQTTTPVVTTSTPNVITTPVISTTIIPTSTIVPSTTNIVDTINNYENDAEILQSLLQGIARNPKNLKIQKNSQVEKEMKLLQALLSGTGQIKNEVKVQNTVSRTQTTTLRSIEEDIRQYEEDTKLLKALLQATGRDPAELNLPSVDSIRAATLLTTTTPSTTSSRPTTTFTPITTSSTQKITLRNNDDNKKLLEDARLLESLLQATGQNTQGVNLPIISGITSNVRISSNPFATSLESNPTSPINVRPVYTTQPSPVFTTATPKAIITSTTFQPSLGTVTEDIGISTTFPPINLRLLSTTPREVTSTSNARGTVVSTFSTEIPSTSTFSVEEDLAFLQNLKSVLNTNSNNEDTEAALANRIIALAVERSLNEIQSGTGVVSSTPTIPVTSTTQTTTTRLTTTPPTTTMRPLTTRQTTTSATLSTPSIEDDLKQFEEDTKLLQALLKATGQDPSKFNIPSLPITKVSPNTVPPAINEDLKLLSNLLANPSPLNEPFDSLIQKPSTGPSVDRQTASTIASATTVKPFGAKIAVKDDLKNIQDDVKLLQTLKQLQDAQDITTQKNKIALTGQSSDEALQKLIQQTKPTGMVSEATKSSISLSTEYGNSNDALLAALLKEQGFGPTTASSLDEQLRLSALLNQVVVTPKTRRTTTPPPPPPAPRRPILDGLAWLWQQWRDTAPGSDQSQARPNRRPSSSARPSPSASPTTSSRVNWFGSGPFVGNADDRPTSNRIPLEPPRAVAAEQAPGRGQLVSAAINVTRAFSQFLGAAIQGAAQTVQNVIRAGQRAATDVYSGGSGASG